MSPDRRDDANIFYEEDNYRLVCMACQKSETRGHRVGTIPLNKALMEEAIKWMEGILEGNKEPDEEEGPNYDDDISVDNDEPYNEPYLYQHQVVETRNDNVLWEAIGLIVCVFSSIVLIIFF